MENKDKKIIEAYLAAPESKDKQAEFLAWLDEGQGNKNKYKEYCLKLDRLKVIQPDVIPDPAVVWQRLEKDLQLNNIPDNILTMHDKTAKESKVTPYIWSIAATVLIALFGYILLNKYGTTQTNFQTSIAETRKITLPDESVVQLNTQSQISFDQTFNNNERRVLLDGQAYFDVTKSNKPFIVETENGFITVVGTAFDINSRYGRTEIIVREGIVKVENEMQTENVLLKANERSIIDVNEKIQTKQKVDADYMIGWLDDRFVFYKTPLNEAVSELERRYDTKIEILDQQLETLTMSGSYAYRSVDSTLQSFCLALDLQLTKESDTYIISQK